MSVRSRSKTALAHKGKHHIYSNVSQFPKSMKFIQREKVAIGNIAFLYTYVQYTCFTFLYFFTQLLFPILIILNSITFGNIPYINTDCIQTKTHQKIVLVNVQLNVVKGFSILIRSARDYLDQIINKTRKFIIVEKFYFFKVEIW